MISEWPPGRHPARTRFLVRNRVIAALACGTVIVEAGERSGALNTARHAANLGKPLMAVPGPVTSAQSAGCHRIIREWGATCVTRAADIIELLSPLSAPDALAPGGGPERRRPSPASRPPAPDAAPSRDDLDPDSARVLDALPARGGAGTSTIAVEAGVDLDTVLRCLGGWPATASSSAATAAGACAGPDRRTRPGWPWPDPAATAAARGLEADRVTRPWRPPWSSASASSPSPNSSSRLRSLARSCRPYRSTCSGSVRLITRSPCAASRSLISSRWSRTRSFSVSVILPLCGLPACSRVA